MINTVFIPRLIEGYHLVATLKDANDRVVGYLDPSRFSAKQRADIAIIFKRAVGSTISTSEDKNFNPLKLRMIIPLSEAPPSVMYHQTDVSSVLVKRSIREKKLVEARYFPQRIQEVFRRPRLTVEESPSMLKREKKAGIRLAKAFKIRPRKQ